MEMLFFTFILANPFQVRLSIADPTSPMSGDSKSIRERKGFALRDQRSMDEIKCSSDLWLTLIPNICKTVFSA
jgi:hypothetical protein